MLTLKSTSTVSTAGTFFSEIGSTEVFTPIFLPPSPFRVIPFYSLFLMKYNLPSFEDLPHSTKEMTSPTILDSVQSIHITRIVE